MKRSSGWLRRVRVSLASRQDYRQGNEWIFSVLFSRSYRSTKASALVSRSSSPRRWREPSRFRGVSRRRLFITPPLWHERRYEGDTKRRRAIPARAALCSSRVRHCAASRLPDYRDKQPEKPRWMTRRAVTVAPRDFCVSILAGAPGIFVDPPRGSCSSWTEWPKKALPFSWNKSFWGMGTRCLRYGEKFHNGVSDFDSRFFQVLSVAFTVAETLGYDFYSLTMPKRSKCLRETPRGLCATLLSSRVVSHFCMTDLSKFLVHSCHASRVGTSMCVLKIHFSREPSWRTISPANVCHWCSSISLELNSFFRRIP